MRLFAKRIAKRTAVRRQALGEESIENRIRNHFHANFKPLVLKKIAEKYGSAPAGEGRQELIDAALQGIEKHGAQLRKRLGARVPQGVSDLRLGFGSHIITSLRPHAIAGTLAVAYNFLPDVLPVPAVGRIDDYAVRKTLERLALRNPSHAVGGLENLRRVYEPHGENGLEKEVSLFHDMTRGLVRESMKQHGTLPGFFRALRNYPVFPASTYAASGAAHLQQTQSGLIFGPTSFVGKIRLAKKIAEGKKKLEKARQAKT